MTEKNNPNHCGNITPPPPKTTITSRAIERSVTYLQKIPKITSQEQEPFQAQKPNRILSHLPLSTTNAMCPTHSNNSVPCCNTLYNGHQPRRQRYDPRSGRYRTGGALGCGKLAFHCICTWAIVLNKITVKKESERMSIVYTFFALIVPSFRHPHP